MNKSEKIFIGFGVFVLLFSVGAYIIKFYTGEVSNDTGDWGAFSDYLNPFIALLNLIVLIILSNAVRRNEADRYAFEKKFIEAGEKPILIFWDNQNDNSWYVKNIGKGAALNIYITHLNGQAEIQSIVKCYSLAVGEEKKLVWIREAFQIIGTYQDLHNNYYTARCQDDLTSHNENENFFENTNGKVLRYNEAVDLYKKIIGEKAYDWTKRMNS